MPRDLADVLHHLIPGATASSLSKSEAAALSETPAAALSETPAAALSETPAAALSETPAAALPETEEAAQGAPKPSAPRGRQRRRLAEPSALPIVGVPIGDRDVVRAAFTWNLAVEMVRLGARAAVVAPIADRASALWPEEPTGPTGADVLLVAATNLEELDRHAREIARQQGGAASEGGAVFVRIPPLWLRGLDAGPEGAPGSELLHWILLLTSSESRDLLESYGIAKLVTQASPGARISVTLHGASRSGEAETAFSRLADVARRRLGTHLTSCGQLVDDLHVYRAIVAQRPIGLVHPQSPAARSMRDAAELVLADARAARDPADAARP